jgi:dihydrodipicolinate synthase/N-acetylneuraminate lyase
MSRQSPDIEGLMGGSGGRFMISEHARGSNGVIHACQFSDLIQRIWDLLDEGRLDQAGDLFEKLLPGLVLEGLMGMAYAKEILVRRGVLKNNRMRMESRPLDEADMGEIDRTWERLQAHLIWQGFKS